MKRRANLLLFTSLSLFALAACSEEETVVAPADPPAAVEENNEADEPGSTGDAARKIREAAEAAAKAAREEAERLAEQGREALKDAGPALERAGEIAGQIGSSLTEIAEQALEDFDKGVALLEKRIAEATGEPEPATGDPEAVLAPAEELNADTRAAARAGPAGVGPAYVGVWAADAASCSGIDQEPVELFAVITPTTIRRYESVCNFATADLVDDAATVTASCIAEGDTEERQITFEMPSPDTLKIGAPDGVGDVEFVRCRLMQ